MADPQMMSKVAEDSSSRRTSNKHGVLEPSSNLPKLNFPAKLHLILSTKEFNDIICWLPHGRAWRVQQQDKLETEILPKFFQHKKAASFYRQVTGWGFHRVISGTDFNAYYHELFLRDAPDLCRKMKRPTRTELSERKQALPKAPPNFYVMPPVSEETTADLFSFAVEPKMTLEEHQDVLLRRLSTYSMTEKGMYLQLELNKLEKKKKDIMRQLKDVGASASSAVAGSMINNNINSSLGTQQQQHQTTSTTITSSSSTAIPGTPSNLVDHQSLLNKLQQQQSGAQSLNPFQSLMNNHPNNPVPSSTIAPSALDQLRLIEFLQQLQQSSGALHPATSTTTTNTSTSTDPMSSLGLANLLLAGGGGGGAPFQVATTNPTSGLEGRSSLNLQGSFAL